MTSLDMTTRDHAAACVPAPSVQAFVDPIRVDVERPEDSEARESLLDRAFGPARFAKTCERLRARRLPAAGLSLVARASSLGGGAVVGQVVGTVRLWHVDAGGVPALMLGPLAVAPEFRSAGVGARLMHEAIERARVLGHRAIILVGDAPYYARFGFWRANTRGLEMPGWVEAERFLGLELVPGALARATGMVRATGALALEPRPARRRSLRRAA